MNKVLIFGSSFVATLASGPSAERRLDTAWNADNVAATAGAGGCHFAPTSELFAHKWLTRAVEASGQVDHYEHANDMDPNSYTKSADSGTDITTTFVEGGAYTSNLVNSITKGSWEDDDILIARLSVDLVMDNYQTLTSGAQANYKFYDWKSGDWAATSVGARSGSSTEGLEQMTALCIYKNGRPDCGTNETPSEDSCCLSSDIGVDISSGGNNNGGSYDNSFVSYDQMTQGTVYNKESDVIHVGLRKILGVATTCGEASGGDFASGSPLDSGKDNIFVWAHLEATATAQFDLTYVKHQLNANAETGYKESGDGDAATGYDEDSDEITYTLTINVQQPQTHDLLFIEEPVESTTTLFSDRPEDANGVTKYRVDYMDDFHSAGGVAFSMNPTSATMDCGLELTVESQRSQHWHCFRNAAARSRPTSAVDSTDFTGSNNGDAELGAFSISGSSGLQDLDSSGTCHAHLDVTCSDPITTISAVDTRTCKVIVDSSMNAAAIVDRKSDYSDCVTSDWFSHAPSFYVNHKPLVGSYETAIVQAVRLTNNRRYPKGADTAPTSFVSVGDSTKFPISNQYDSSSNSNFQCGDATQDCSTEDPYVLLHAAKVEAELEFENGVGPFTTTAYDGQGEPNTGAPGGDADDYYGDCAKCTDSDTSTWSTCKVYDKSNTGGTALVAASGLNGQGATCDTNGPSYTTGDVDLINPPENYPEAYVFGVATFSFSTKKPGEATREAATENWVVPKDGNQAGTPSRRLRETKTTGPVQTTLFVNAMQNVVQK
tara:strand:+ start:12991 stop:15315 length:2325 start_codon:yes stop_codon:yes gene_type:complete